MARLTFGYLFLLFAIRAIVRGAWFYSFASFMINVENIDDLPDECLNWHLFDECFAVELPVQTERAEIFEVILMQRGIALTASDYKKLAEKTDRYSCADIETLIHRAIQRAFVLGQKLDINLLMGVIADFKPEGEALWARLERFADFRRKYNVRNANSLELKPTNFARSFL